MQSIIGIEVWKDKETNEDKKLQAEIHLAKGDNYAITFFCYQYLA